MNFKRCTCNWLQWLHCCGTQAVTWINVDSTSMTFLFWHSLQCDKTYGNNQDTNIKFIVKIYTFEVTPTSAMGNKVVILSFLFSQCTGCEALWRYCQFLLIEWTTYATILKYYWDQAFIVLVLLTSQFKYKTFDCFLFHASFCHEMYFTRAKESI